MGPSGQGLDLRRSLTAMSRRRVPLLALVAVGIVGGVLVAVLQPPTFVARSSVLLAQSSVDASGTPVRDMETEVNIARSAEILAQAGAAFDPPAVPEALRGRIRVEAASSDILEVQAEAGSASRAAMEADAVASSYVNYSNDITSGQARSEIAALQERATELDQRIRQLDEEVNSNIAVLDGKDLTAAERLRQSALVDSLRLQQVEQASQLSTINNRIEDARLTEELSRGGARVLEPARAPDQPASPRPLLDIGVGAGLGLVAGALMALTLEQCDRRLRTRDEIAEAVGAPVLASLSVPRCEGAEECRALLEQWAPSVVESLALHQAFTRLGVADDNPPVNVVIITLSGDHAGPLLALQVAAFSATIGIPSAFVVASHDASAALLRAACAASARAKSDPAEARGDVRRTRVRGNGRGDGHAAVAVRPDLSVRYGLDHIEPNELRRTDLTVSVVVAAAGPLVLPTWGRRTLTAIAVSSGFATRNDLASAAAACADAGYPVGGVLLANPEPTDATTGGLGLPLRGTVPRIPEPATSWPPASAGHLESGRRSAPS